MQSKLLIAGAIVAVIAICAIAVAALSLSQGPGQASTSARPTAPATTITPAPSPIIGLGSVTGSVIDSYGQPLPGLLVTLHLIGHNETASQAGSSWEIYNLTSTTHADEPFVGTFVFDNVELVPEQKYAYITTEVVYNGIVYSGVTSNFTLETGTPVNDKNIVLHAPKELESLLLNRT